MTRGRKHRKRLKDTKRIIRLAYRKGVIPKEWTQGNPEDCSSPLAWYADYNGRNKEIAVFGYHYEDYWGEGDVHEFIELCQTNIINENSYWCEKSESIKSKVGRIGTTDQLIRHLNSMPTIRNDSSINKFLKVRVWN